MNPPVAIAPFGDPDLPALAEFWNRAFVGARNFFPVTPELLRLRLVERVTAVERFEPEGLLLARAGGGIVGLVHVGRLPEAACRALDPAWPGGERGWVGLLCVLPEFRRQGIGGALWARGQERLRACQSVFVDGEALNPFYGNSGGPETPFFGTPEGIGLPAEDRETIVFLERRGHRPRATAVTLTWTPAAPAWSPPPAAEAGDLRVHEQRFPELGAPLDEGGAVAGQARFFTAACLLEGVVAGALVAYEMTELARGQWGIYSLAVDQRHRRRGWGGALLAAAVAELRRRGARACEVLTVPERSPGALGLYRAAGFVAEAEWAVY